MDNAPPTRPGVELPSCPLGFPSVPCRPEAEDPGENSQPWGMAGWQMEEPGPLNDPVNQSLPPKTTCYAPGWQ